MHTDDWTPTDINADRYRSTNQHNKSQLIGSTTQPLHNLRGRPAIPLLCGPRRIATTPHINRHFGMDDGRRKTTPPLPGGRQRTKSSYPRIRLPGTTRRQDRPRCHEDDVTRWRTNCGATPNPRRPTLAATTSSGNSTHDCCCFSRQPTTPGSEPSDTPTEPVRTIGEPSRQRIILYARRKSH